jgi:hypothetical protein
VVRRALLLELTLPLPLVALVVPLVPLVAGPVGQQFAHPPILLLTRPIVIYERYVRGDKSDARGRGTHLT